MAEADADYEEFLQAFERPTQIYRYLRKYHQTSPCFLQRTLSYMQRNRCHRRGKLRSRKRSVNQLRYYKSLLDQTVVSGDAIRSGGPLELSFLVFREDCDSAVFGNLPQEAIVEVTLHKEGFRRSKESSETPVHDISLGTFSVPCEWRFPGPQHEATHVPSYCHQSSYEGTLVVPLGLFGFSMPGGYGVKSQKLVFKVLFPLEENAASLQQAEGEPAFCESSTSIVMSPSPSSKLSGSSSPPASVANDSLQTSHATNNTSRETTSASTSAMDTSPSPAKRHCIAPVFSENGVSNNTSPSRARSLSTVTSPVTSVKTRHCQTELLTCCHTDQSDHSPSRDCLQRYSQQLSDVYSRRVPVYRSSDSCDDDGRVDWSQWNGELTQSSAACNRKVQPLLRKNRELRGLVLDDPPDNTGLPEFSYARGRRGYTKPAGAQPCVQLVESPYSSSKMLSETPARTPTPPVQPPSPPAATSVCHSIRGSVYSFEVPVADDSKTCLLEAGYYDMAACLSESKTEVSSASNGTPATSHRSELDTLFPSPATSGPASDLSSQPIPSNARFHKQATWESYPESFSCYQGRLPGVLGASLQFVVTWPEGMPQFVQLSRPEPRLCADTGDDGYITDERHPQSLLYNFIYQNGQRQQTETVDKLACPWCRVTCPQLYSLLKHLQLLHPRFLFSLVQRNQAYEIDVCLNTRHDVDFDSDIHPGRQGNPDFLPRVCGPQKRSSFTKAFYGQRGRRLQFDLKEFQLLGGVGRLFFHCRTALPILPSEVDEDSEDEDHPPPWISTKMTEMLDEFTDVNDGEKAMMKLWNDYILKERIVVDSEMPAVCQLFTKLHASTINRFDLHRNFLLHLTNLCDFGLIGTDCLQQCLSIVKPANNSYRHT